MLKLVEHKDEKISAQKKLENQLKKSLTREGVKNIGFQSGNIDTTLYTAGEESLWCAFGSPSDDHPIPRYWNAFGVYKSNRSAQDIVLEVNIASNSNDGRVAGFYAVDEHTGETYLMHSGRVGGGRPGIGKAAFLLYSKHKLLEVLDKLGNIHFGIPIAKLGSSDLPGRIWYFVQNVRAFKESAVQGSLPALSAGNYKNDKPNYSPEFFGRKQGKRNVDIDYITYHGQIVQELFQWRSKTLGATESIGKTQLIDLYVEKAGRKTEIYEVKTSTDRQAIYTAIGQLVVHAAPDGGRKILVLPVNEELSSDIGSTLRLLEIQVRRFNIVNDALVSHVTIRN